MSRSHVSDVAWKTSALHTNHNDTTTAVAAKSRVYQSEVVTMRPQTGPGTSYYEILLRRIIWKASTGSPDDTNCAGASCR